MTTLPKGWTEVALGDVCEIVSGATPKTSVESYWGGPVRWATPKDLSDLGERRYLIDTPRTLTEDGLRSCGARILPVGSVLFSSRAPVGLTAINTVPVATNQGFKSLVPSPNVDAEYLYWWLSANRRRMEHLGRGATFKEVSKAIVAEVSIPLPPLEEQRRIAAILDKADELRAKRRAALEQLDSLTQAIFLDMFGDPIRGTSDRSRTTLGEAAEIVGGGTPSRDRADFFEGTICWATSKDMKDAALRDTQEHITRDAISASATKLVPPGAVLVVVKSKVLAKRLPVAVAAVETCFGQDLKAILPSPRWQSSFLAESIRAAAPRLLRQARGVNTEGLTLEHLRSVPLWDATTEEQAEFDRRVEAVSRSSAAVRLGADKVNALFAAFQSRAFRGEL